MTVSMRPCILSAIFSRILTFSSSLLVVSEACAESCSETADIVWIESTITLLAFLFGPIEYNQVNKPITVFFIFVFLVAACISYRFGVSQNIRYRFRIIIKDGKVLGFNSLKIIISNFEILMKTKCISNKIVL